MGEIVVIGGGIVGQAAAYELASAGASVTLIDRADDGQATAAGAGILSPGTGALGAGPFRPLATAALAFYPELLARLAEDGETDTGYAICGGLFVATSEEEAERLPERFAAMEERRASGMANIGAIEMVDGAGARALFPPLADIPAGIYLRSVGRVNGRLMRDSLRRAAIKRGATVIHGSAEIVQAGGRATGVNLPLYPQRGQILHLDVPGTVTTGWPVVLGFHSQYILAFPEHRVVAGATREHESGFDYRLTAGGVHEVLGEALRVAPGLATATVAEMRIGLRPTSPDGLPVVGKVPGYDNIFVSTGHGASGLQLGPHSGALAARMAQGQEADIELTDFAAERFGG